MRTSNLYSNMNSISKIVLNLASRRNFRRQKKPLEINEWSENKDGSGGGAPPSGGASDLSGAESINVTGDIKMDIDLTKELSAAAAAEGGEDNLENANPKN